MNKPKVGTSPKGIYEWYKKDEQQQFLECKLQEKKQLWTGAKTNRTFK